MPILVTLELPAYVAPDLDGIRGSDLQLLLGDALGEFISHRANGDAIAYVNKRYPLTVTQEIFGKLCEFEASSPYPPGPARERKIQQVQNRCKWAQALRHFLTVRIENNDGTVLSEYAYIPPALPKVDNAG